jgi:hypothetical protein
MALTEFEKQVLDTLAEDVRRSDHRLYAALRAGRRRRLPLVAAVWLLVLGGGTLVVTGDVLRQPWLAIVGWLALIAAALLNVSRQDAGARPHPDGG